MGEWRRGVAPAAAPCSRGDVGPSTSLGDSCFSGPTPSRQRDLLPAPLPFPRTRTPVAGARRCQRRAARRMHMEERANLAVRALNDMYGRGAECALPPSPAQDERTQAVVQAIRDLGQPPLTWMPRVPSLRSAARAPATGPRSSGRACTSSLASRRCRKLAVRPVTSGRC